ncbi:MAG: acyl carrier protein [Devosiaceae bacterium]
MDGNVAPMKFFVPVAVPPLWRDTFSPDRDVKEFILGDINSEHSPSAVEDRGPLPTKWPDFSDTALVDTIIDVIAEEGMVDREKIIPTATIETLGLDSIEVVMILNGVEEKFEVYIPMDGEIAEARNLAELVGLLATQVVSGQAEPAKDATNKSADR